MAAKKKAKKAIDPKSLSPAGSSSDARVHYLLAERQALTANAAAGDASAAGKIADVDAELAELGFTAS